jgi:hypothetical protein
MSPADRSLPGEQPDTSGSSSGDRTMARILAIGCGVPAALAIIVVIVIIAWPKDSGPRAGDAIAACERIVSNQLKSPSTADFNSAVSGDNPWTVVGSVDAENSFGAEVRLDYQCTVRGTTATIDTLQQR